MTRRLPPCGQRLWFYYNTCLGSTESGLDVGIAALVLLKTLPVYTVFQKSDAKIQITITTAHLIRINYPLSSFNYRLSGTNVVNFNKIHHMVSEQQLFNKWNLKTEFSNMENTD